MHNAYSPPFTCTLIDIPTISRFACGDIIVVLLNRLSSPALDNYPVSCIKRIHEFEERATIGIYLLWKWKVSNRERIEGDGKWKGIVRVPRRVMVAKKKE